MTNTTDLSDRQSPPTLRVALLDEEEALSRGRALGIDDYICKMNLFRVLLRHPELARQVNGTIMSLVGGNKVLSDRLRELIIMRVSWLAACDYEWSQHWMASLYFGISEAELVAVRDWVEADAFNEAERAVLAATDELVGNGSLAPDNWAALAEYFPDEREKLEIVACIGNWHMCALLINGLGIPLEEGIQSWPPDGLGPAQPSTPVVS